MLSAYTKLVAFSTLFLIFAGAMVTSHGAGLSVPDWPTTYGENMFTFPFEKWVGNIFYEHSHRLIASMVGLLTVIQAFWLQRRESRRFVRILGWIAVGAVIAQGMLGGLTVIFLLPPAISISHAALAEIFFCLNVSIAFFTSKWFVERRGGLVRAPLPGLSTFLAALVYLQILVGALMRHLGAGLAIPDFPLAFGRLVPNFTSVAIAVHYAHRVGAVIVVLAVFAVVAQVFRHRAPRALRRLGGLLAALVVAQIALGAWTIWTAKQPIVTSLHVAAGALTLAVSVLLALSARSLAAADEPESITLVPAEARI